MRKIVGIGETVFDIVFKNDIPQTAVPGGSTFNALISLGRTAAADGLAEVLFVSETGSDHVGDIIVSFMQENGVNVQAITRNPGTQSHISLAFLDGNNDAHYQFYKDHAHASVDASKAYSIEFNRNDIVLFGSFFAINPVIRDFTRTLLQKARAAGAIIFYDINFRRNHRKDLPSVMGNIEENCRLSDFVRGSADDFDCLYGCTDSDVIYNEKLKGLCQNLIVTQGAGPTQFFRSDGRRQSFPVEKIETVSTIGAGDNFNAGFIYGLLRAGILQEDCHLLDDNTLAEIVHTASLFSANVCKSINNYVDPTTLRKLIGNHYQSS